VVKMQPIDQNNDNYNAAANWVIST
jgi:hypothetical protein